MAINNACTYLAVEDEDINKLFIYGIDERGVRSPDPCTIDFQGISNVCFVKRGQEEESLLLCCSPRISEFTVRGAFLRTFAANECCFIAYAQRGDFVVATLVEKGNDRRESDPISDAIALIAYTSGVEIRRVACVGMHRFWGGSFRLTPDESRTHHIHRRRTARYQLPDCNG